MPNDESILIQAFRVKYLGAAKSIAIKRETLWLRTDGHANELLLQVWIAFDGGRVIIEKGTYDRLAVIASEPISN